MNTLLTIFIGFSHAFFFGYEIPQDKLLLEYNQAPAILESKGTYTLTTWNIYKGKEDGLYEDLQNVLETNDFVLMQEFLLNGEQQQQIDQLSQTHWAVAKSFKDSGKWTGVATASKWQPYESVVLRSPGSQPLANTPKMSLISKFKLADGQELWIVNMHGLNFNLGHGDFKDQLDQVLSALAVHKGPLIFAGDLNTWADERYVYLLKKTIDLGLVRAPLESPMGVFNATLDHIFYRGLAGVETRVVGEYTTSDHLPLEIRFAVAAPSLGL